MNKGIGRFRRTGISKNPSWTLRVQHQATPGSRKSASGIACEPAGAANGDPVLDDDGDESLRQYDLAATFVLAGKPPLPTLVFLEIASLRSDAGDATETGLKVEELNGERATVTGQIIKFGVIEQHPDTLISMDQYISDPITVKASAVQHLKLQRQTPPSITGVSERRGERRIFDIEHSTLLAEFMWQKVDVGASLPAVTEKGVPYTDQHKKKRCCGQC